MRKLKAGKADKSLIDAEVAKLLALKGQLAAASGTSTNAAPAPGGKAEGASQKKNKKK